MTLNGHFALHSVLCRYVLSSEAWLSKLGYGYSCSECCPKRAAASRGFLMTARRSCCVTADDVCLVCVCGEQVPAGVHRTELLVHLDRLPIFCQQISQTIRAQTVGKAATFSKVSLQQQNWATTECLHCMCESTS